MDEDQAINIIAGTFHNSAVVQSNISYTFNPIDKVVGFYERLVEMEREKVALLVKGK